MLGLALRQTHLLFVPQIWVEGQKDFTLRGYVCPFLRAEREAFLKYITPLILMRGFFYFDVAS